MIRNEDGCCCAYCGRELPIFQLTLDHIIPQAKGGKTTKKNLVLCCRRCNTKKGCQMLYEVPDIITTNKVSQKIIDRLADYYYINKKGEKNE